MNLKICFFILFSLMLNGVLAQHIDRQPVRFGVRAGINFSHVNFSRGAVSVENPGETTYSPGATVGLLMIVPLGNILYVQPEYSYTRTGGEIKDSGTKYKFHYLSLPVFLRLEIGKKFVLLGGPQFELLIDASQETPESSASIIHETEERSIGLGIGSEYQIHRSFMIGFRYIHGFNNISISTSSGINEFKYENIQFAVMYIF